MIELFEQNVVSIDRQSSKGNQLKWKDGKLWYKADYTGYEGLVEYLVSNLLKFSTLDSGEYVLYQTEEIFYKRNRFLGCRSINFLPDGWQLITLERLFQNFFNESLNKSIYLIEDKKERLAFLVNQVIRITGLADFGIYMSKLITMDALFLNEDRHTHNIAVLRDEMGKYHYCPIFDNGAALLADTMLDYPLDAPVSELMQEVEAKTFCRSFEEQLDAAESLYGQQLHFSFTISDIEKLLEQEMNYPKNIKIRVLDILTQQKRKYEYLF